LPHRCSPSIKAYFLLPQTGHVFLIISSPLQSHYQMAHAYIAPDQTKQRLCGCDKAFAFPHRRKEPSTNWTCFSHNTITTTALPLGNAWVNQAKAIAFAGVMKSLISLHCLPMRKWLFLIWWICMKETKNFSMNKGWKLRLFFQIPFYLFKHKIMLCH